MLLCILDDAFQCLEKARVTFLVIITISESGCRKAGAGGGRRENPDIGMRNPLDTRASISARQFAGGRLANSGRDNNVHSAARACSTRLISNAAAKNMSSYIWRNLLMAVRQAAQECVSCPTTGRFYWKREILRRVRHLIQLACRSRNISACFAS